MESLIPGYEHDICFLCGARAEETHHIFEGSGRRKICDRHKLVVRLCNTCHDKLHDTSCPEMKYLHELGQKVYEEKIGTREQFRKDYIRSYL